MRLVEFADQISGFDKIAPRGKIQIFAWYLHEYEGKEYFTYIDIKNCFNTLHIPDPNVSKYLSRLVEYKELVKEKSGYKLVRKVRTSLNAKYRAQQSVVVVNKLLNDLLVKIPDLAERNFLAETIKCYRVEAYRACLVMTWNLSFSHLIHWILKDDERLNKFNTNISRRYPKKSLITVANYDQFSDELKESEIVEICNTAGLINKSVHKILKEKLDKRNTAAHPSSISILQPQADDMITDLVNNVVLKLI